MAAGEFDKDFGYLIPFLDRVLAAADSLSDDAARNELSELMADEKAKWARVRELLSGSSGAARQKLEQDARQKLEQEMKTGAPGETTGQGEPQPSRPQFTVGSLRRRES